MFSSFSSLETLLHFAYLLSVTPIARASFSSSASASNVAIYWGQNSHNQGSGPLAQQNLAYYCANTEINIIPLAFLTTIKNPTVNFADAGDKCTLFPGSELLNCSQIAQDIAECQNTYKKTILLSIGGATYTEGGFASPEEAVSAANNIWATFGPPPYASTTNRPFGSASVDGFDFDFESVTKNMAPFAKQLRSLMDAHKAKTGKQWMLTAAPQCPYPDAADNDMLAGQVFFDAVFVQFYNNYCGVQSYSSSASEQSNFNFDAWDKWAKTVSLNPNVKVMLGIPGSSSAAGSGYMSGSAFAPILSYCKSFSSFGGVMIWDVSQVYANDGFLGDIIKGMGGAPMSQTQPAYSTVPQSVYSNSPTTFQTSIIQPTYKTSTTPSSIQTPPPQPTAQTYVPPPSSPSPSASTPSQSSTASSSSGSSELVHAWNQCGGLGWNGGTVCVPGYTCMVYTKWYSDCRPLGTTTTKY